MIVTKLCDFLIEQVILDNLSDNEVIAKSGSILFHGSGEKFDKRKLKVGGYDKVFWTTDSPLIAQTYIPTSGTSVKISTKSLTKPSNNDIITTLQEMLNIAYRDIQYKHNMPSSWIKSEIERRIYDKYSNTDKMYDITRKIIELKEKEGYDNYKKLKELEKKYSELLKDNKAEEMFLRYINKSLEKIGISPIEKESEYNFIYEIKQSRGKILKTNENLIGTLFILETKRDFKFYDNTMGGNIEGDLTNLDYHKIGLFRKLESMGYDGIKINDFAQSVDQGNIGHLSYGFFNSSIKDLKINHVDAIHREIDGNLRKYGWDKTPEYENFLNKV